MVFFIFVLKIFILFAFKMHV